MSNNRGYKLQNDLTPEADDNTYSQERTSHDYQSQPHQPRQTNHKDQGSDQNEHQGNRSQGKNNNNKRGYFQKGQQSTVTSNKQVISSLPQTRFTYQHAQISEVNINLDGEQIKALPQNEIGHYKVGSRQTLSVVKKILKDSVEAREKDPEATTYNVTLSSIGFAVSHALQIQQSFINTKQIVGDCSMKLETLVMKIQARPNNEDLESFEYETITGKMIISFDIAIIIDGQAVNKQPVEELKKIHELNKVATRRSYNKNNKNKNTSGNKNRVYKKDNEKQEKQEKQSEHQQGQNKVSKTKKKKQFENKPKSDNHKRENNRNDTAQKQQISEDTPQESKDLPQNPRDSLRGNRVRVNDGNLNLKRQQRTNNNPSENKNHNNENLEKQPYQQRNNNNHQDSKKEVKGRAYTKVNQPQQQRTNNNPQESKEENNTPSE